MIARLLRMVARLALRWFYRTIDVVGLERIPATGPAILAANHNNALVDALVIATSVPRPVRLTAKATLLDHPFTRWVVHAVGIIPLRRASDERARAADRRTDPRADRTAASDVARDAETPGAPNVASDGASASPDAQRNADSFRAIIDALGEGSLVLIFPEGRSHSEPALAPLKTGCARLALQTRRERAAHDLPIIPVGLTFEDKGRPRTRVLMQVGVPITAAGIEDGDPEAVQQLTGRIDAGIRSVTLNFASTDGAEQVLALSPLLAAVLDRVRPLDAPDPPLVDSVSLARRLEHVRQHLPAASLDTRREVETFLERLDAFRASLHASGVPVNDLWMSMSRAAGARFAIRESLVVLLAFPMAMWGRVNHWLPLFVARQVGRLTSKNPDEPAMHTLVSGLALVLLCYLLVATLIALKAGGWWALLYLASLPPAASLDFWLTDRLARARRRAAAYLSLRDDRAMRRTLIDEASWLRAEARRLDAAIPRTGDGVAPSVPMPTHPPQ